MTKASSWLQRVWDMMIPPAVSMTCRPSIAARRSAPLSDRSARRTAIRRDFDASCANLWARFVDRGVKAPGFVEVDLSFLVSRC